MYASRHNRCVHIPPGFCKAGAFELPRAEVWSVLTATAALFKHHFAQYFHSECKHM